MCTPIYLSGPPGDWPVSDQLMVNPGDPFFTLGGVSWFLEYDLCMLDGQVCDQWSADGQSWGYFIITLAGVWPGSSPSIGLTNLAKPYHVHYHLPQPRCNASCCWLMSVGTRLVLPGSNVVCCDVDLSNFVLAQLMSQFQNSWCIACKL